MILVNDRYSKQFLALGIQKLHFEKNKIELMLNFKYEGFLLKLVKIFLGLQNSKYSLFADFAQYVCNQSAFEKEVKFVLLYFVIFFCFLQVLRTKQDGSFLTVVVTCTMKLNM